MLSFCQERHPKHFRDHMTSKSTLNRGLCKWFSGKYPVISKTVHKKDKETQDALNKQKYYAFDRVLFTKHRLEAVEKVDGGHVKRLCFETSYCGKPTLSAHAFLRIQSIMFFAIACMRGFHKQNITNDPKKVQAGMGIGRNDACHIFPERLKVDTKDWDKTYAGWLLAQTTYQQKESNRHVDGAVDGNKWANAYFVKSFKNLTTTNIVDKHLNEYLVGFTRNLGKKIIQKLATEFKHIDKKTDLSEYQKQNTKDYIILQINGTLLALEEKQLDGFFKQGINIPWRRNIFKEDAAVKSIQAIFRGRAARAKPRKIHAARMIQSVYKSYIAAQKIRLKLQKEKAKMNQSVYKKYIAAQKIKRLKLQKEKVVMIQKIYRGIKGRAKARKVQLEKTKQLDEEKQRKKEEMELAKELAANAKVNAIFAIEKKTILQNTLFKRALDLQTYMSSRDFVLNPNKYVQARKATMKTIIKDVVNKTGYENIKERDYRIAFHLQHFMQKVEEAVAIIIKGKNFLDTKSQLIALEKMQNDTTLLLRAGKYHMLMQNVLDGIPEENIEGFKRFLTKDNEASFMTEKITIKELERLWKIKKESVLAVFKLIKDRDPVSVK